MDEGHTQLQLSQEAIDLFFRRGGFVGADPVVHLRSLLQGEQSEAVKRAAERWNMPPFQILRSAR